MLIARGVLYRVHARYDLAACCTNLVRVLFPEPDRPTIPMTSPGAIEIEMLRITA
jgi:hypothetical protein